MRENRTYGSQGGEAKAFPTPIEAAPVREDADELSEGVADVEAAHAPGLARGSVFDATPAARIRSSAWSISSTSIDRSGVGVPEPPCEAMLGWTSIFVSAP